MYSQGPMRYITLASVLIPTKTNELSPKITTDSSQTLSNQFFKKHLKRLAKRRSSPCSRLSLSNTHLSGLHPFSNIRLYYSNYQRLPRTNSLRGFYAPLSTGWSILAKLSLSIFTYQIIKSLYSLTLAKSFTLLTLLNTTDVSNSTTRHNHTSQIAKSSTRSMLWAYTVKLL